MNSPDFWRWGLMLCPDHRGYVVSFGASLNPIGGEYLEIPSIRDFVPLPCLIRRMGQATKRERATGSVLRFSCDESEVISLMISYSVSYARQRS